MAHVSLIYYIIMTLGDSTKNQTIEFKCEPQRINGIHDSCTGLACLFTQLAALHSIGPNRARAIIQLERQCNRPSPQTIEQSPRSGKATNRVNRAKPPISTWYQVPGTRNQAPDTTYLVCGTRYLVPATWYHIPKCLVPVRLCFPIGQSDLKNVHG